MDICGFWTLSDEDLSNDRICLLVKIVSESDIYEERSEAIYLSCLFFVIKLGRLGCLVGDPRVFS
jgi:hypothetical protein